MDFKTNSQSTNIHVKDENSSILLKNKRTTHNLKITNPLKMPAIFDEISYFSTSVDIRPLPSASVAELLGVILEESRIDK